MSSEFVISDRPSVWMIGHGEIEIGMSFQTENTLVHPRRPRGRYWGENRGKTSTKKVNEDPACLYVGSHRRSDQPNLKKLEDDKFKDYCKADTT